MSGIYWLASYPKSGNTWLRALLTNYRRGSDEPASINDLDGGWDAVSRDSFDDEVGIESSSLTLEQIEHYRPLMYERLAATSREPVFLKIHDRFSVNADACPVFSRSATRGVIYLVRNPLDIAVSFAHHRAEPVERTIGFMRDPAAMVPGSNRPGDQLPQRLSSWSDHVRSWVDESGLDCLLVRYEDMLVDTSGTFMKILSFAGTELAPTRVEKAVEYSRFKQLQAQEIALGFAERQPTAVSFFRAGGAGAWQDSLPPALVRAVIDDHGDMMRRLGYLKSLE